MTIQKLIFLTANIKAKDEIMQFCIMTLFQINTDI